LRYSDVLEAQRRHTNVQHRRHDPHVQPTVQFPQAKPNYLAWIGGLVLSLAAAAAFFGGWFQRMLTR
jgi:hypothetical protein